MAEQRAGHRKSLGKNTRLRKESETVGQRIDQFRVIRALGEGGMGVVYLARDTQLGRKVALKLLKGNIDVQRFVSEGRITAQFNHPHIVTLYAVGTHRGRPYMALEYLEGQTLRARLKSSPPRLGEAIELALAIASALAEAHRHKVAHLDLKPSNIITPADGRLRVLDFGLACMTRAPSLASSSWNGLQGTPAYMAPEQWKKESAGEAADIWAFGTIFYEMLSGKRPFQDYETTLEAFESAIIDQPIPQLDLPSDVSTLMMSCLERKASDRPPAPEVEARLKEILDRLRGRTTLDTAARHESPYRGLLPFDTGQSSLFFGRNAEITELSERLRHAPIVPVIGPSGVGKSSLIRAGLIPQLTSLGGWTVLEMRPGPRPFQSLRACLDFSLSLSSSTAVESRSWTELQANPKRLCLELEERVQAEQDRFLIFVDQMEEIFTLTEDPKAATIFLRAITSAADDLQTFVRVIFTLRDDYLVRACQTHPTVAEAFHRPFFVHTPGRSSLIETLVGPLRSTKYHLDEGLADKMVDDAGKQNVSLPLLQFAAHQLWEERDEGRLRLTTEAYDRMGGVSGALIQHGDRVLDALGFEDIPVARDLLLRMVTSEQTRKVVPSAEALEGLGPHAERVLDALIAARLITTTRLGSTPALELAHESLILNWDRLHRWVDAQRDDLRFLAEAKEAAELWKRRGQRRDEVWMREALAEAKIMLAKCTLPVPGVVQDFIDASLAFERRRVARQRGLITVAIAFLLIVAGVLVIQRNEAEENAARAEFNQTVAKENAALAEENAARAELDRATARREAAGARNASRLASATLHRSDPTLLLALVREMEPSGPRPPQWRELARWATRQTIAEVVLTHENAVYSAAFSPDGRRIVTASHDQAVRVWPADGTKMPRVFRGHQDRIWSASVSPDGTRIVTASPDKTVRMWNMDGSGSPVVFRGHNSSIWSASFSPDGTRIVSASSDKTVRVWRVDNSEPLLVQAHPDEVWFAAFSPDGTRIITTSSDKIARVWPADGSGSPIVLRGHLARISSASFSPDGTRVVTAGFDNTVRVWRVDGSGTPLILRGHQDGVYSASFSPDGTRIVTASQDRTVRVWRADGSGTPLVLRGHQDRVYSASFNADGTRVISASRDKTVRVWRIDDVKTPLNLRGHQDVIYSASFSPDGRRLVTTSKDKTIRVWRADGSGTPVILRGHADRVHSAVFSPDGTRIVSASRDGTARVWRADGSGTPVVLRGHQSHLWSATFSPDGTQIVTGGYDKTVRVWRADGSGGPRILRGHAHNIQAVSFHPDGTRVVTGSFDKTARVWRIDGSESPLVLRGHQDYVYSASFSPDGTRIVTASFDKTARVWDFSRPNADGSLPFVELHGHEAGVGSGTLGGQGAFSPDGARLLTFSDDKTLRIWNIDGTGVPAILRMPKIDAYSAAFSPDGTRIVTASHSDRNLVTGQMEYWATIWPSFKPLTGLDDPELWTATRYCPPVKLRVKLLGVSLEEGEAQRQRCQDRVVAAQGRSLLEIPAP